MLESEAAAMFCQQQIFDQSHLDQISGDITSHYLMVDCGGKTVKITAHKLIKTSKGEVIIEEMHQAYTDTCGSLEVNNEFEKLLEQLFQLTQ